MGFHRDELADLKIYAANGCSSCNGGYKGRVGVYEVVKVTPEISKIIMEDGNAIQIAEMCQRLGFNNIFQSALRKVKAGVTSLEEVDRVTSGH